MNFPLVGNSNVALALTTAINEKRLPHAIIIEGDIGTGRHTLASFIAGSAICSGDNPPCLNCENCRLHSSASHPDITVTSLEHGKKNISVAQIRAMRDEAYIKPHLALCKVFIIDPADTLNEQSQNAILKVLEEPPGAAVFILITESKSALLSTIISRCVVLSLSNPEYGLATEYLKSVTDYPEDEIEAALKSCQNNIGKSLSVLKGKADTKAANSAKEFFHYALTGSGWDMLKTTSVIEKSRIESAEFFKALKYITAEYIRNNPNNLKVSALIKFYDKLSELEKSLTANINLSLLFSSLVSASIDIFN